MSDGVTRGRGEVVLAERRDVGAASPLERFLPEYVESAGGAWEEVEPKVYDVLLPAAGLDDGGDAAWVVRVTFDPEAVQEHPGSQLLLHGSPLLDRMLAHAQAQGRVTRGYLLGVHPAAAPGAALLAESVAVPEGASWRVERMRPLMFPHVAFWFEATYLSDEKEQETYAVAVDLYHGRFARHLEGLLRAGDYELAAERPFPCPDAPRRRLAEAYLMGRERVAATALSVGRGHQRQQEERVARQVARMEGYYRDLAAELEERLARAQRDGRTAAATLESLRERLRGIGRESAVRVAELRQRSALRVSVRLTNLMLVAYPKLRVEAQLTRPRGPAVSLGLVWDPLAGQLEPPDCPACGRPTRELLEGERRELICPAC